MNPVNPENQTTSTAMPVSQQSQPVMPVQSQPQNEAFIEPQAPQAQTPPTQVSQQATMEQPAATGANNKKAWTLVLAWITFIASAALFIMLGPVSLIMAIGSGSYWLLVSLWWMPLVYKIFLFAMPAILILAGLSTFLTYRKFPSKMRTVAIMFSSIVIGAPIAWLALGGMIPMRLSVFTIIMGIVAIMPILILIAFKIREKRSIASFPAQNTGKAGAVATCAILLLATAVELVIAVILTIAPLSNLIAMQNQQKQREQAIESAAESSGSKSSDSLAKMVYAVCRGEYDVVYQSNEDTGIFECKGSSEVYSVTDYHKGKTGYYSSASAAYLGNMYDETVEKYFKDTQYMYRNFRNENLGEDLILLVEAQSEDEVIENTIDGIYECIKEKNSKFITPINVIVFYTEKLDTAKSTLDYVVLSTAIGTHSSLPNGNVFGEYAFDMDYEMPAIGEIASNPSLYSSQTRDALKFHRHIFAEIDNGRKITKDELYTTLKDSFKEGL